MDCFIFDIDGVITDIDQKIILENRIPEIIANNLSKGIPHIFISGRSLDWIRKIVLPSFESSIDKNFLDNLLVMGEFGENSIVYEDGEPKEKLDTVNKLPIELVEEATRVTEKFKDIMFVDTTKKTQFTSEVKNDVDLENIFKPAQSKLAAKYQALIHKYGLESEFDVHEDRLGTNIRNIKTNKSEAIRKALIWLEIRKIIVKKFIVFGDSPSDLEMGQELFKENLNFEFVFVGRKEELPSSISFPVNVTKEKFEKGTLEYLNSLHSSK